MRAHEFTNEVKLPKVTSAQATAAASTGAGYGVGKAAEHVIDKELASSMASVPGLIQAVQNLAKNRTLATIGAVQALLPWLKGSPEAFRAVTDALSNSSSAATVASIVNKIPKIASATGGALGSMSTAMTPATLLAAPAFAAGAEKEKIDANPNAPEYADNPYAMTVRGQADTIGAAGKQNRKATVQNFATAGNAVPQQNQ